MPTAAAALATALLLAAGEPAPPPTIDRPAAVSLTVSGGVSLGAYEAGFLSYFAARQHRDPARLRLLTGASAGSLNALIELLAACGTEAPARPIGSLFWSTWIPVGLEALAERPAAPLGALSRRALARGAEGIEAAWARGLDPACDVVLGVSVTRVEPRLVRSAGGSLVLPRMEEKFAVRIQGRGPGRPPRATNYPLPAGRWPGPLLVTDPQGEIAFAELRDLVLASMAFPVAFPPMPIRACTAGETATPGTCLAEEARTARYVDGGLFDNSPLRAAVWLAALGLHQPGPGRPLSWRDAPLAVPGPVPDGLAFAFLDTDVTDYPPPPADPAAGEAALAPHLLGLAESFVAAARAKELGTLAQELPEVADRVLVPRRQFPAAGAPLMAFLGFFDAEFRAFDFHLGMYDAFAVEPDAPLPEARPGDARDPWPGEGPGWERFGCMRAVYRGEPDAGPRCAGEPLADFRALLQVSLDKLYFACASAAERGEHGPWASPHCERASMGSPPPRVPGLAPRHPTAWRREAGENELGHTVRLLAAYGFRFADLGVPPGRGDLAIVHIRQQLGRVGRALAAAQPVEQREPVRLAAKLAADVLAYAPPDRAFHLTMGPTESELGLASAVDDVSHRPPHLRLAGAVAFRGLEGTFTSEDVSPFAALLLAGVELEPTRVTPVARLRAGLRAGWQLAKGDHAGARSCPAEGASVSSCTRPVVQAVVGLAVLERLRLQLVGEWFPAVRAKRSAWAVAPGIGIEIGF